MKKSIIAMAVAGALAVPAIASADATLYGSLRAVMEKTDNEKVDLENAASRLGVRGNVDLGMSDTTGIYQVEFRFNPVANGTGEFENGNNVTRGGQSFLGATGSWGTALVGVLDHPTESLIDTRTEISSVGFDQSSLNGYPDATVTSTIAYVTPNISGFQAIAGMVVAGGDNQNKSIDGYNLGASFNGVENLNLAIAYGKISRQANLGTRGALNWGAFESSFDAAVAAGTAAENAVLAAGGTQAAADDAFDAAFDATAINGTVTPVQNLNKWGVAGDYTFGSVNLAASYDRVKNSTTNVTDKGYGVAATYNVTDNLSAALRYTTAKTNETGADRRKTTQLEVANTMGNGVVAAGYVDRNSAQDNGNDTFYVGYRLNF